MGSRVYDPIHDVFQTRPDDKLDSEPLFEKAEPIEDIEKVDLIEAVESSSNNEKSAEYEVYNTLSEEDIPVVSAENPIVPSVSTGKKKMKESSKYNRHLKKPDGDYFSRNDMQYHFVSLLLSDKRLLFTNIFKDVFAKSVVPIPPPDNKIINVSDSDYDARTFVFNEKLTFSQAYILSIACSTKGSKVLRDKLLLDQQIAFAACVLGVLVNVGRLNTTVNFYLEMTSQLRTFHSVPCLQYGNSDPKALQDTPRLKSILKSLSVGNDALDLPKVYDGKEKIENINIINLLFIICDNVSLINLKFFQKYVDVNDAPTTLFGILDTSNYDADDRCNVLLWLLYIHLETDLSDDGIERAVKKFAKDGETKLRLHDSNEDYDVDPQEEIDFGLEQLRKRREFMEKIQIKAADEKEASVKNEPTGPAESTDVTAIEDNENDDEETSMIKDEEPNIKKRKVYEKKRTVRNTKEKPLSSSSLADSEEQSTNLSSPTREISERIKRIENLLQVDRNKSVCKGLQVGKNISQTQFLNDLKKAHIFTKLKRKELGLMKAFNEFEDIPLASVIGVRGRKRKKFQDRLLGFETDYLKYFGLIKKRTLETIAIPANNDDDDNETMFKLTPQ